MMISPSARRLYAAGLFEHLWKADYIHVLRHLENDPRLISTLSARTELPADEVIEACADSCGWVLADASQTGDEITRVWELVNTGFSASVITELDSVLVTSTVA